MMKEQQQQAITTQLALGIDAEVVALLQAHGCLLEQCNTCLWVTYPLGTRREEIYPRVHTPRYLVTLPDGYQVAEHGDISSGLYLLYYQPPDTPRHPLHLETAFRFKQGQRVRVLVGPEQGRMLQVQGRQLHTGLECPPRYRLEGDWYEEQDLAPVEVSETSEEREEPAR